MRRLFNKAKRTGEWDTHRSAVTCYNKAIRKVKRSSWKRYCQGIEDIPDVSRLVKIMSGDKFCKVGPIRLPEGSITSTCKDFLKELV